MIATEHSPLFYDLIAWIDSHFDDIKGYCDIPIGTIDGAAVLASYTHDGEIYSAEMTWHGMEIYTDGETYVNLNTGNDPGNALGCVGDMHIHEWETVKALAQTGVMDQLIALARQYATLKQFGGSTPPA
jgi:hypothetical protein